MHPIDSRPPPRAVVLAVRSGAITETVTNTGFTVITGHVGISVPLVGDSIWVFDMATNVHHLR